MRRLEAPMSSTDARRFADARHGSPRGLAAASLRSPNIRPANYKSQTWLYVQEYAAPAEIELDAVRRRRNEALSVLPEVTGVPEERIHVRTRRRILVQPPKQPCRPCFLATGK